MDYNIKSINVFPSLTCNNDFAHVAFIDVPNPPFNFRIANLDNTFYGSLHSGSYS